MKKDISKEYDSFESLSYQDKLNYWDNAGINFHYDTHCLSGDIFVSVRPYRLSELVSYNKWIIDHWRHYFFNEEHQRIIGFNTLYKPFEDLVLNFDRLMKFKDRKDVIEDEIRRMNHLILSLKVKSRLLRLVFQNVKDLNEEDIYRYEFKSTSVLINLKEIAKVLDMVKYLVFLKRELTKLQERKHSNALFSFAPLSKVDSEATYDFLVVKKFIHSDTDKACFVKLLTDEEVPWGFFIKWIDKAEFSDEVNKHTLFDFVNWVIGLDTKDQRAFMKCYFKTINPYCDAPILKDITTENLKASMKSFRQKNEEGKVSERQQMIIEFAETKFFK